MKRSVLLLSAILFSLVSLQSQAVIWEEDFSTGLRGWTTRTDQCGKNFGGVLGSYGLTSVTVNGAAVTGIEAELNLLNALEYSVNFDDGTNYGTVYARYTLANDIMDSNLDAAAVPLSGRSASLDANSYLITSTAMEVSQAAFDDWASTMSGINDPTVTLDGSVLTMTSGNTVITFTNKNVCAGMWHYSADGNYGTPFTGGAVLGSATGETGIALFNGVMQTWLENNDNLDPSIPSSEYPEYTTSIITPDIDISSATRALALEFTQAILFLNVSSGAPAVPVNETFSQPVRTAFEISTDGGANYSAPIELNESISANSWFITREIIPLPADLIGDATSIKIRFTFGADFYFWALDDVAVVERSAYDMQINENFYSVYPNLFTPISQADTAFFLADIQNNGGLEAENVKLNVTITNAEGTEVYNDTKDYGTIIVDSIAENQLFDQVLDPAVLAADVYSGAYVISHDSTEAITNNDTIRFQFVMTDTMFQKEAGFVFGDASGVTPADDVSYSFGNVFYCPNGEGFVAKNISFGVANADELAGRSVTTYLYKWADTNDDGIANSSEYGDALAINSYSFDGTESDEELITIPFDFEGNDVPLEDNTFYLAIVQYINSSDEQDLAMLVSRVYDYNATTFAYQVAGTAARYPVVLNVGPEPSPDYSTTGFGRGTIPMIRMSIGNTVNAPEVLSDANKVKVFPNPTNNDINLEVELVNRSSKVQISIIDGTGRIIQRNAYNDFKAGKFNYDLSNLTAGMYFIRILTDEGLRTEKVFLQR